MKRARESEGRSESKRVKNGSADQSSGDEPSRGLAKKASGPASDEDSLPPKEDAGVEVDEQQRKEGKPEENEKELEKDEARREDTEKEQEEDLKLRSKEVTQDSKESDSTSAQKSTAAGSTKGTNASSTDANAATDISSTAGDNASTAGTATTDATTASEANKKVEQTNETESSETEKPAAKPLGFSSFGSGFSGFSGFSGSSKFGSLANAPKKNPWAEPSGSTSTTEKPANDDQSAGDQPSDSTENKETTNNNDSTVAKETTPETDTYAQVKLAKQEVKTGEEDEDIVFQVRVRLYAINLANEEQKSWKERGTGLLKLNKSANSGKYRLVMRADSVLRVSLNIPLVQNMQVSKGFPTSLHTEKFVKFSGIEDGSPHQYAVRCASESQRDELFDALTAVFEK